MRHSSPSQRLLLPPAPPRAVSSPRGLGCLPGLDNAGKTTLLYRLKSGRINSFIPTQRANIEDFVRSAPSSRSTPTAPTPLTPPFAQELGGVSFKAFDLGGHAAVRKLWGDYMTEVDAVVFVVDSNDAARHDEARDVPHPLPPTLAISPTAVHMPADACSAVDTTCLRIGRSCTRWWGRRASRPPLSSSCATRWTYPCGPSPSLGIECGMLSSLVAQTAKPLAEMEEALGAWPTTSSRAVTQDACPPPRHECHARTRVRSVCPELS